MIPTFKGYGGFPASACVSINEEVVHGIPSKDRIIKEGDIVSVDVGSTYKGYVSDAARTYAVGEISKEAQHLIDATRASFFAGLEFCKVGYRLSDISHAIQKAQREKDSLLSGISLGTASDSRCMKTRRSRITEDREEVRDLQAAWSLRSNR